MSEIRYRIRPKEIAQQSFRRRLLEAVYLEMRVMLAHRRMRRRSLDEYQFQVSQRFQLRRNATMDAEEPPVDQRSNGQRLERLDARIVDFCGVLMETCGEVRYINRDTWSQCGTPTFAFEGKIFC